MKPYEYLEDEERIREITHSVSAAETWPELVEEFVSFLRGVGFVIPPGQYEETDYDTPRDTD